jgi:NAD(P)-dependent dehydrogenase (short-subunit alcohol dehydrogenase family)
METIDKLLVTVQQHKTASLATALLSLPLLFFFARRKQGKRVKIISKTEERVLVIGASSGVGRKIANLYARRGARVCIVGRRADKLEEVRKECMALYPANSSARSDENQKVLALTADMTKAEDLVAIRECLKKGSYRLSFLFLNFYSFPPSL